MNRQVAAMMLGAMLLGGGVLATWAAELKAIHTQNNRGHPTSLNPHPSAPIAPGPFAWPRTPLG